MPTQNPPGNIINLSEGESLVIRDHRGFNIVEFTEAGDIKIKGEMVKIV